jgi:next to BRCA1 gene 1 protein
MCETCDNFTLCIDCFLSDKYQHHPAHAFALKNPDPKDIPRSKEITQRLRPGRGLKHRAHCDECKEVCPI